MNLNLFYVKFLPAQNQNHPDVLNENVFIPWFFSGE